MSDPADFAPEQPGPSDFRDPTTARELKRAAVWLGLGVAIILVWFLAQPLLLIVAGLVFASMLDGGTRLLGRVLPIGRGWRLAIVCLATMSFLVWTVYFAGASIAAQFETLQSVVTTQFHHITEWAHSMGMLPHNGAAIRDQMLGSIGQVTMAVGSALGAISSLAMIVVIGIFVAIEPRLYERGVAWMLPMSKRREFYQTSAELGSTIRRLMAGRLLGMAVEGVGTWILLMVGGVPMAALLGILTGLLAFLPNIGAIISGVLLVLVGFSAGVEQGLWAIGVYLVVQIVDGYVIVPMVAKRSVDLAPALVLGAQILFGALFGILGLALADPIVAMIKVLLEESSENNAEEAGLGASPILRPN
ncbi:Predicted PurR-regulated permease PerM [Sphingomonas laterariae]|uniref:Predicted PurR-regulated permease PerM n=1 Tax=Edaphosphingomonas laterariae TaxID=861865 RepID=A0A239IGM9_9SPHN|nr:AI-2E family transporter [Sphingomonas laterariae]SNS92725.1 Predicted PurR-regulated permease PerM [Sphingomonas laterariae]